MTKEQIAELRRLHDNVIAQALGPLDDERVLTVKVYRENAAFMVECNNRIVRLLNEREMLLAAAIHVRDRIELRSDIDWCRGEHDFSVGEHAPCGDAVALAELKTAIAKAET